MPQRLSHQHVLGIGPEAGAYRSASLVSEEMPDGKGPVSMFAFKVLAGPPQMQRRSMRCVRVCRYSERRALVSACCHACVKCICTYHTARLSSPAG